MTDEQFISQCQCGIELQSRSDPLSFMLGSNQLERLRQYLSDLISDKDLTEEQRQANLARVAVLEPHLPRGYQKIPHA